MPSDMSAAVEENIARASKAASSVPVRRRSCLDRLAETLILKCAPEGREFTGFLRNPFGDRSDPIPRVGPRTSGVQPAPVEAAARTEASG